MAATGNYYKALSELVDDSLFTNDDNSIDYLKLFEQFPLKDVPPGVAQSERLPHTFAPNKLSSIYRSTRSTHHLIDRVAPDLLSLHDHFEKSVELKPDLDCLGTRLTDKETGELDSKYTFDSFKTVQQRRNRIGSGIKNLVGRPRGEHYIVSIFSSNRAEWVISSLAVQAFGLTSTALYDTLGPNASKYILNLTESPILITTYSKLLNVIDMKKSGNENLPFLKYLVSMDDLDFDRDLGLITLAAEAGLRLIDFKQLERIGELKPLEVEPRHEIFCISFTSGTTGNPKGVLITQKMAISGLAFVFAHVDKPFKFLKHDEIQARYYSFLPLAHIYELMNIYMALSSHYKVYFPWDPSPLKIVEHFKMIKPHYVTLVPRVYTKFESALKTALGESFFGRQVVSKIVEYKQSKNLANQSSDLVLLDSLLISKIRNKLGFDSVSFCVSGSAPISKETVEFLKAALNVGFKQGYGLTESFSGISTAQSNENEISSGPIGVSTEMRLKDVPEMNYISTDPATGKELDEPQGELLLRGPQIFPGYYKNETATKEVLDEDGWFSTGDIAKIDRLGRIHIVDRVKNFFKLAQGEYVTPERIENVYLSSCSSILSQCFVHGDSLQTYLIGILGIDPIAVRKLLKKKYGGIVGLSDDELLKRINEDYEVKRYLLNFMNRFIKQEGLQGFELLHNFKVKIEPLKLENEVITPTMKIKRSNASKFFRKDLDELYSEGSLLKNSKL